MKRIIVVSFIFVLMLNSSAQTGDPLLNIIPEWKNISLVSGEIPDSLPKILVITNRPFEPENKDNIIFPNGIAQYRKVSYLEVAFNGANWLVKVHDNFHEAMKILDSSKDILLFVHGHGKTFNEILPRSMLIKNRYNVSLILFDWPAKNSNFNKSLARVRRCSDNFYSLLLDLENYRANSMGENQTLSVLAHSLGNYYLTHFVVNGCWQYIHTPFIDNIIFNAPAVRSKEHGEVISLINISKNKYVVLNKNDRILRGANLLTSGKMLGNVVIEPFADNTSYINFTNIAGKEHTYFVGYNKFENDNPAVFNFYNTIIHGGQPNFSNGDFEKLNEKEYMIK